MASKASLSDFLHKFILELDYQKRFREFAGNLALEVLKYYDFDVIVIEIITDIKIPFYLYASKSNEKWAYYEGNNKIPDELSNGLKGESEKILLDGNEKGRVYIVSSGSESNHDILKLIAGIIKKKLIWDREILDDQCYIIEKILRKGNHDIRSPFFGVSGFAQLINQKSSDPEIKGFCKTMLESLDRVESIITELVSGFGDKPLRMRPENFSITEIMEEIAEKSKEMYARSGISLDFESAGNFYIDADKELIKNAIYGVLNNSREELLEGGEIKVSLNSDENAKAVEISIKDTGKGIPADILDMVFKPVFKFQKGEDHLGLGLSNSLNIIKSHGGNIRIKNNCEKNTEFIIDLPLAEKED